MSKDVQVSMPLTTSATFSKQVIEQAASKKVNAPQLPSLEKRLTQRNLYLNILAGGGYISC